MNCTKLPTPDLIIQGRLEGLYLKNKRRNIYIALENVTDTDFFWSMQEIQRFDELWFDDIPIRDIAKEIRRTDTSVFLLAMDRVFRGKIEARRNWSIW